MELILLKSNTIDLLLVLTPLPPDLTSSYTLLIPIKGKPVMALNENELGDESCQAALGRRSVTAQGHSWGHFLKL